MSRTWRNQDGLSMVEALVAMAILAIISAPIMGAFLVARSAQAEATGRTIAQSLARDTIENAQTAAFASFDNLPVGTVTDTTTRPPYTIVRTVTCTMTDPANNTVCVLKSVDVQVKWMSTKNRQMFHNLSTLLERRL